MYIYKVFIVLNIEKWGIYCRVFSIVGVVGMGLVV